MYRYWKSARHGGNRTAESFIFLAPGTTGNTFDAHINGSQTLSKEIQIDGLSATTAEVGGDPRVLTLPPEAIQEFALVTSNFAAEFGNTGGGVEQFTIRIDGPEAAGGAGGSRLVMEWGMFRWSAPLRAAAR